MSKEYSKEEIENLYKIYKDSFKSDSCSEILNAYNNWVQARSRNRDSQDVDVLSELLKDNDD